LEATNNLIKLIKRNAFALRNSDSFKKRIFYRSEYKNGEDINYPLQILAFIQPTTVDKEPNKKSSLENQKALRGISM